MFEKEIKFIGDFCLNQVRNLGNTLTFEKIQSSNLHPAIVRYVSAELDYMIYADRRKLLQQSFFDYSGKEIAEYFYKISYEIKRNKKISSEDLHKLILQAVSFNVNYLVRPRWSLTKLIFNEQPIISVNDLHMILNYLFYYEYFKKVLSAYLDKRNMEQITLTEFDLILNKIDREIFKSNPDLLIDNALTSMGDFFNIGGVDKNIISSTAIEIFLKEKNMLDMVFKLRKGLPEGVKKQFDKNDVKRILFAGKIEESKTEEIADLESELEKELDEDFNPEIRILEEESNIEESEIHTEPESANNSTESFLSPEEEKTLLSLYNGDVIESEEDLIDDLPEIEEELTELADEQSDESILKKIEEIKDKINDNFPEAEPELPSIDETFDEDDDVEVESEEIVGNKIEDEIVEDDTPFEIEEELVEEVSDEQEDIDESGVEKEIVQEMLKDFMAEELPEEKSEAEPEEKPEEPIQPEIKKKSSIESLEDELLNIFQDLDTIDASNFRETKMMEDENTDQLTSEQEIAEEKEEITEPKELDPLDEYLKSVDEIIFSDNKEQTENKNIVKEVNKESELKSERREETKEEIKVEENPEIEKKPTPPVEKQEKIVHPPRTKDLFSYLRKKEIKKIVSYIFVNDEEDFMNTAERIMDCHSYKEASEILKAVFTSYKISPYSKEAITFTNSVSNYFRQA